MKLNALLKHLSEIVTHYDPATTNVETYGDELRLAINPSVNINIDLEQDK